MAPGTWAPAAAFLNCDHCHSHGTAGSISTPGRCCLRFLVFLKLRFQVRLGHDFVPTRKRVGRFPSEPSLDRRFYSSPISYGMLGASRAGGGTPVRIPRKSSSA